MTRTLSTQARTAQAIRAELKTAFPSITFKVRSESFAGGDAVDVDWEDGPTTKQVDAIVRKYQYGHFDGMIDLYEYTNRRQDIPQVKYVQTHRSPSRAAFTTIVDYLNDHYAGYALEIHPTQNYILPESDKHTGHDWQSHEVNRRFHRTSFLCNCGAIPYFGDAYCEQCGEHLAAA